MNGAERRFLDEAASEVRVEVIDGKPRIVGYAAVFNSLSVDLGGFREVIRPGAFASSLANSDARALINHDPNLILGRESARTLRLVEDSRGLRYEIDPPDTTYARDLAVSLGRRDISGSSFRFYMFEDQNRGQVWRSEPGGVIREITEFRAVDDVTIATYPAYPQTEVALRCLEAFRREAVPPRDERWLAEASMRLGLVSAE
jgi:uncharacterized protein